MLKRISIKILTSAVPKFWIWWVNELSSTHESLFMFKQGKPAKFLVDDEGNIIYHNKVTQEKINTRKIHISIPEKHIMFRVIRLPRNACNNIKQVIKYEFDKYFPLSFESAYFGNKILQHSDNKCVSVGIWAIRRKYLNYILSKIENEYEFRVKAAGIIDAKGQIVITREIVNKTREKQSIATRKNIPYFGYIVTGLITLCLLIPPLKMKYYSEELTHRIRDVENKAKDIIVVKNKMSEIENRLTNMIKDKKNIPSFTSLWSDTTNIVAGNGIVTSMRFHGKKITLEGKAISVEKIVKLLEESNNFKNVSIDAPVRRLARGKFESMNISFTVSDENQ